MEEALSRQEYPAMLERLQPSTAVQKLNERVKDIARANSEIADWIQDRSKLERAYAEGLSKLADKRLQGVNGQLGVFESPWRKIITATANLSKSHSTFAERIYRNVEEPLRSFNVNNREMTAMTTIQGNLAAMAKELEDAQDRSEKLSRKGGKASAQKVDTASSKLQNAQQQWDSQAPFIFETLQALDERRLNHLRDILTQYETFESDKNERDRKFVEDTLPFLLDIDTAKEIKDWAAANISGKPVLEKPARQSSFAGSTATSSTLHPPPTSGSGHTDNQSEHSHPSKETGESKLKSRFGTMLGRRRQSIQGTFNRAPSPSKGFQPFSRSSSSRDGRPIPSPRASSTNLRESPSRQGGLESLAESPPTRSPTSQTNGNNLNTSFPGGLPQRGSSLAPPSGPASPDLSDVEPPPGPPPSHLNSESQKDSDGFNVPGAVNDPISQAEHDAAQEGEQPQFKLDIRKDPIPEQDADAQAALSNVANTLRSAQIPNPNRKSGTVRGRRDVRSTMYMPPSSLDVITSESPAPPSPGVATGRAAALAALSSGETSHVAGSDTTSIRSGHSLSSHVVTRHADMHSTGLNASIVETLSASFDKGILNTMEIKGEIALLHNKSADEPTAPSHETIRIDNFPNLEVIGPNRTFVHPVSSDKTDEFTIDLSPISSKSSVAFTYRGHVDTTNPTAPPPLIIKPAWKVQNGFLGLIVDYSLNPAYSAQAITFHNFILRAIYQGSKASAAQLKPSGVHIKDQYLVYWKLGDVLLSSESQRVVCRFIAKEEALPEPGHIEARWEIHGSKELVLGSGIGISRLEAAKVKEESDDPFADESIASPTTAEATGTWVEVETHKKFVSGKYEVK